MDFNDTSSKNKRVKGIRSVREQKLTKNVNPNDVAFNKLFNNYLNVNPKPKSKDEIFRSKLEPNQNYYSDLLKNNNQLKDMNMMILSQVLLYLNLSSEKDLPDNLEEEITPYIDDLIGERFNVTNKTLIDIDIKDEISYLITRYKTYFEFFSYIRFVKNLENNIVIISRNQESGLINPEED